MFWNIIRKTRYGILEIYNAEGFCMFKQDVSRREKLE